MMGMGINPLRKPPRPLSQEQVTAAREQAELRKRARAAEQAESAADIELAASEPTPDEPGSAWKVVKSAADARAQRKLVMNTAITKKRAEDAEATTLSAPEPPPKKSKVVKTKATKKKKKKIPLPHRGERGGGGA